jgi:hypothetical protein
MRESEGKSTLIIATTAIKESMFHYELSRVCIREGAKFSLSFSPVLV